MKSLNVKVLNSSDIKMIAFVTMLIDHFAYFFYYMLTSDIYIIFRILGRISMPLYTFSVYQAFKHTSDLKRYMKRLVILSITTQIIIMIIGTIISVYIPTYNISFYKEANIVFSFLLSIIFISLLNDLVRSRRKDTLSVVFDSISIISIIALYFIIDIDYGLITLLVILLLYVYDSWIKKEITCKILKNIFLVTFIVVYIMYVVILEGNLGIFSAFSIFFIALYNGKKGHGMQRLFYHLYVLQYVILYGLGAIVYYINFR